LYHLLQQQRVKNILLRSSATKPSWIPEDIFHRIHKNWVNHESGRR
jgi:hypothetical protein